MGDTNHIRCQTLHPKPYEGTILCSDSAEADRVPITHMATYEDCAPLLDRVGIWAICTDGLMALGPGCGYFIAADRFDDENWVDHMREKAWVDIGDFGAALGKARAWKRAGYMVTFPSGADQ